MSTKRPYIEGWNQAVKDFKEGPIGDTVVNTDKYFGAEFDQYHKGYMEAMAAYNQPVLAKLDIWKKPSNSTLFL